MLNLWRMPPSACYGRRMESNTRRRGPAPGSELRRAVLDRWLRGESLTDIARSLGMSRQRASQHLARARVLQEASARLQIHDVAGVDSEALKIYLRRQLAAAGIQADGGDATT